jgi:hypothetical protein
MRPSVVASLALLPALFAACGSSGDDDGVTDPDGPHAGSARADVTAVTVAAETGGPPVKGAPLRVTVSVHNTGDAAGTVRVTPVIVSARFADFAGVTLGTAEVTLAAGETRDTTLVAGPFLVDADGGHVALGRGDYTFTEVDVEIDGVVSADVDFTGPTFTVAASNAVFDLVLYDPAYFTAIGWTGTPEAYVLDAYHRAGELFTPSSPGSDTGTYQAVPGGFDEMMGIEHHVLAVPGLVASEAAGGFCEQVTAQARTLAGLTRDWDVDENQEVFTSADHHGFDVLIGLTPAMGGGAACGWLGVQVSGLFTFDLSLDRSQIILVHETGHLFGAPHCDPLQGYVMCAGEQHAHYRDSGIYVWHQASRDVMANHWQ